MPERVLPRAFPIVPQLLIPLSNAELQELGTFTAIWGQIDFIVLTMIAHLIKADFTVVLFMLDATTTGPRIAMLSRLCQQETNDTNKAIKKLCDDNGGLIEDRNHIIHGLWAVEWNTGERQPRAACNFPKRLGFPIAADKLKELTDRAARFSNALGQLLGKLNPGFASDRPQPLFFGKITPSGQLPRWPPE